MNIKNQVVIILLCYLISILFSRGFLYGIKRYQLNNSAYKKRKKEENFKEWLIYSRYKEEIPRIYRIFYYAVLIFHPICLLICLFVYITALPLSIGEMLAILTAGFDVIWMLAITLLFWSPGRGYAYERWITKIRKKPK